MKAGLAVLLLLCVAGAPSSSLQTYSGFVSNIQEFWNGIYLGMQTTTQPDPCVTKITSAVSLYSTAYTNFIRSFSDITPTYLLTSITSLAQAFDELIRAVETCQAKVLTYNIVNIFNRVGFGKALINLSVNMSKVVVSAM